MQSATGITLRPVLYKCVYLMIALKFEIQVCYRRI